MCVEIVEKGAIGASDDVEVRKSTFEKKSMYCRDCDAEMYICISRQCLKKKKLCKELLQYAHTVKPR